MRSCYAVMLLTFSIDFLLLSGVNRLCKSTIELRMCLLASCISALYSGVCLLEVGWYLCQPVVRMIVFAVSSVIAFGFRVTTVYKGGLYILLKSLVGTLSPFYGESGIELVLLLLAAIFVLLLRRRSSGELIPVELPLMGDRIRLMALRDTGNMLRDPISGSPVLVVGADTAKRITGLSNEQLRNPVDAVTSLKLPGLRMIPYHTVGESSGFLLAIRMQDVKIGDRKGSYIVAFSPVSFERNGKYQALAGGAIC